MLLVPRHRRGKSSQGWRGGGGGSGGGGSKSGGEHAAAPKGGNGGRGGRGRAPPPAANGSRGPSSVSGGESLVVSFGNRGERTVEVRPGGQWFLQDPRGAKLGPYTSAEIVTWFGAVQVAEGAGGGWRDLRGALAAMGGDAPARAAKLGKEAEKASREKGAKDKPKDKPKDKQKEPEKPPVKAGTEAPPTPADPAGEKGPARMEKVAGKAVTGKGSLAPDEADVSGNSTGGGKAFAAGEAPKGNGEVATVAEVSPAKAEGAPIRSVAATNSAKPAVPAPKPDLAPPQAPAPVEAPVVTETPAPASALVAAAGTEPAPTAAPKSSEAPSKDSAEAPVSGAAAEAALSEAPAAPAPEKSLPDQDPSPSEVSEWLFFGGKGAEGDGEPLWRYVDNHDKVQGPFGAKQMILWHQSKFFQDSLQMLGCSPKLSPPNLPPTSSYRPFGELLREATQSCREHKGR